jgi:NAD(P)-dependent dehydrogenase (short-subunit alcohol dehydrogenase family)
MNGETSLSGLRKGDAVVVTGAAQGIGRAIAVELARRGANIVLWDVAEAELAKTESLCKEFGAQVMRGRVDVSDASQIAPAADAAIAHFDGVFGLVNNAGIFPRVSILDVTPETWRTVLGVNLLGTVFCSQALARDMVNRKRGAVVNIASGRALQGTPRGAHYAASKAGIVSFTKSFALELAVHGLRANCVIPGVTETAQPLADTTVEELHERGKRLPLGRIGQPEDIARVVAFLLSEDAAYMTGQSVAVNGGAIMIP